MSLHSHPSDLRGPVADKHPLPSEIAIPREPVTAASGWFPDAPHGVDSKMWNLHGHSANVARESVAREVQGLATQLADALVDREFARRPTGAPAQDEAGVIRARQEALSHLQNLAGALAFGHPSIFSDYIAWVRIVLARRNVPPGVLRRHLQTMAEVLVERLSPASGAMAAEVVRSALRHYDDLDDDQPAPLLRDGPLRGLAEQYLGALLRGERHVASQLILDAATKVPVAELYLHVIEPVQREIGRLWQTNRISVAEEHYCTAATQLVMSQLYRYVFNTDKKLRSLVATSVSGEMHEVGARMVCDFFELQRWNTYYLGANVPPECVVEAVIRRRADLVAVSVTMSCHLEAARELIQALRKAVPERVKILVGGYLFSRHPELWRSLGADGSAVDAAAAVALGNRLVASVDLP